jgi:hypothetical protein
MQNDDLQQSTLVVLPITCPTYHAWRNSTSLCVDVFFLALCTLSSASDFTQDTKRMNTPYFPPVERGRIHNILTRNSTTTFWRSLSVSVPLVSLLSRRLRALVPSVFCHVLSLQFCSGFASAKSSFQVK